MTKKRKLSRIVIFAFVVAAMFSLVALADSYTHFAYTYNSQTLTSSAVTKSNLNAQAKVVSLNSYNGSSSNALDYNGTIEACSRLSTGGGRSGSMVFTSDGQTKFGAYSTIRNNQRHVLETTLTGCDFIGRAMYQYFSWLP